MGSLRAARIERRNALSFASIMLDHYATQLIALPSDPDSANDIPGVTLVGPIIPCPPGGGWLQRHVVPRHDDAPAQISLTSGTTGTPKPILLSHRALGDVTERLVAAMSLDDSIREYIGIPVTYSFGLGRIRAIASVAGAAFLPDGGFRAVEFAQMLEAGEVNALSAVPTLLRVLLAQPDLFARTGERLRWLEIGSQAMSRSEKEQIRTLFPNARIVQHYGLTEASRTTFLDISRSEGAALDTVGAPNGTCEIALTEEGLVRIRGRHVADGILTAGGLEPLVDADGWLTTRDLGGIVDGLLLYRGRADDLINVAGVKVPSELFEEKLAARLSDGTKIAVAPGRDPLRGEIVVIAHADDLTQVQLDALRDAASDVAAGFNVRDGYALLPVHSVPLTETGKVRRTDLSARYEAALEAQLGQPTEPIETAADPAARIFATYVAAFGEPGHDESASFESLGGDSLSYISVMFGLQTVIGDVPDDWATMSIGSLVALTHERPAETSAAEPRVKLLTNLDTIRACACILVVIYHVIGNSANTGMKFPDGSWPRYFGDSLEYVRMPLFTAMAGFFYATMPATRNNFVDFFRRRARQLLIPMLFVMLVTCGGRVIEHGEIDNLIEGLYSGYLHLWYIYALMDIFIIVALLDIFISSKSSFWLVMLLVAPLLRIYLPFISLFSLSLGLGLMPFFILGVLFYRRPALLYSSPLLGAAIAVALVGLAAQQLMMLGMLDLGQWGPTVRYPAGCAVVIILLRLIPRVPTLGILGAYSFTIYLWHPLANGAARSLLQLMHMNYPPLIFTVGVLAGILLPVALYRLMLRMPMISLPFIGR